MLVVRFPSLKVSSRLHSQCLSRASRPLVDTGGRGWVKLAGGWASVGENEGGTHPSCVRLGRVVPVTPRHEVTEGEHDSMLLLCVCVCVFWRWNQGLRCSLSKQ